MTLPDQQTLLSLLSYCPISGLLHWRRRPVESFKSLRVANWWNARYAFKQAFTAVDRKGYNIGAIGDINYRTSRVIYKMVHGIEPDQVDHEDGNTLNNRISNLRNVTGQVNQQNMKKPINNTSGVVGVIWNAGKNAWDARIGVKGKHVNLGRFKTFNEAVAKRKQAEIDYGFHPNHGR